MKLTQTLIDSLYQALDSDPVEFVALRFSARSGSATWKVSNGTLTITMTGASNPALTIDLTTKTVGDVISTIVTSSLFDYSQACDKDLQTRSARVLIDGSGSVDQSGGDPLTGYTSLLWAYMDGVAAELYTAQLQIKEMLDQLSLPTADSEWLDVLGGKFYNVHRTASELDSAYFRRVIAEILRPRSNNFAIAAAIKDGFGQDASVDDVRLWGPAFPSYNNAITYNGTRQYNGVQQPLYGLFDVSVGYDLLSGLDMAGFAASVAAFVENLRAAGTHMRALALKGSGISDAVTSTPTDGGSLPLVVSMPLTDAVTAPTDSSSVMAITMAGMSDASGIDTTDTISLSANWTPTYNGLRSFNGAVNYTSGVVAELL